VNLLLGPISAGASGWNLLLEASSSGLFNPACPCVVSDAAFAVAARHHLGEVHWALRAPQVSKQSRHDRVKCRLARLLTLEGHKALLEPRAFARGQSKPDVVIYHANGSRGVVIDVTITLADEHGHEAALNTAAAGKVAAYRECVETLGHTFLPFAMSTRGAPHQDTLAVLGRFFAHPRAVLLELQCCLAAGNAAMVAESCR
jgi:hypothetical protein